MAFLLSRISAVCLPAALCLFFGVGSLQTASAEDMRYAPMTSAGGSQFVPQAVRDNRAVMERVGVKRSVLGYKPKGATFNDHSIGNQFLSGSTLDNSSNTQVQFEPGASQTNVDVDAQLGDYSSVDLTTRTGRND